MQFVFVCISFPECFHKKNYKLKKMTLLKMHAKK